VIAATLERPGAPSWSVRELVSEAVGAWEPAIDPAAWSGDRQVHMLVQRVVAARRGRPDGHGRGHANRPAGLEAPLTVGPPNGPGGAGFVAVRSTNPARIACLSSLAICAAAVGRAEHQCVLARGGLA